MSSTIYRRVPVLLVLLVTMSLMAVVQGVFAQSTNAVELVGAIESMSLNTISINQRRVDISTAEMNTPLEVGAVVKVEGTLNQDGTVTARQVNVATAGLQPGEAEIIGVLESLNGTTLFVNGQTIDASTAEIKAGVEVGKTVKAHAIATGANSWQAREVEVFEAVTPLQPPVTGEFEITGTLESIGSDTIVVAGQTISITGAEIKDPLVLGTLVKVHVSLVNGQLTAREVENTRTDDNTNSNSNANENQNSNENSNGNENENGNTNDNTNNTTAISTQQAIDIALNIYPNATVRSIELTTKFGGTLVWEVKLSNRIEVTVDAQSGTVLTIDRPENGDNQNANNNDNGNLNGNDNSNDNGGMGSDDNSNQNGNNDNNSGGEDNHGGNNDNGGMG